MPKTLPKCPNVFDIDFERELLGAMGADVSIIDDDGCPCCFWVELAAQFPSYMKRIEQYLERATTGDPAGAVYSMVFHLGTDRAWAEGVIEQATTGDPAHAAQRMAFYCGSDPAWARGVIEQAKTGDPADAALWMARGCDSDPAWAEKVAIKAKEI